jgi:hypothetical protein
MSSDTLIHTLLVLVIVGVILWAVNAIEFIAVPIKKVINIVAVVGVVIYLINVFFPGTLNLG